MKRSANQSNYSSTKSLLNSKQQNNLSSKKNQISEFQKPEFLIDEKANNSQLNSMQNSQKPSNNNSSNHNGGQDIESFMKGKKQVDEIEMKDKKEINNYNQDIQNERKMSINNTNKNQEQQNKLQKVHQNRLSNAYKLSLEQRQIFANFRMKRDLWIRDLQEVFNKIYEKFVNTLNIMKENSLVNITKDEKLKFRKHLRNQMKEIKKIAESLSDKNDDFINLHDNLPITHYYKNNIMEMHRLLQILLKLQMDNKQLDKIKFQKKYENKCSEPLIQEIKRSYRRVQRLKAGNRLGQVINDQLEDPQIAAMIQNNQKNEESQVTNPQSQIVSKQIVISVEVPRSSIISSKQQSVNNFQHLEKSKNTTNKSQKMYNSKEQITEDQGNESEEEYDPYSLEQEIDKKYLDENQNLNIDQAIKEFNRKKLELQSMISKFVEKVDEKDFNFNEKYLNFKEYFSKRNELMGMYLGDHQLNKFIDENEKRARQPIKSNDGYDFEDDEFQNLYKDLDPNNFQVDDRNIEALQRIIKINEEIRKNLIEEEHANKVKILDQMNVEQNQQFWTSVFEKRSTTANQLNGVFNKNKPKNFRQQENLSSSQSENQIIFNKTHQNLNFNEQGQQQEETKDIQSIKKQQMKLYHDYIHRNVNYSVHPSNPNLKPLLTGKYDPDKIKFTRVSENQPINIVSSLSTVEKESQIKKMSIINKTPYTNKIGDDFQKTFYQSTFYSSGSLPPANKILSDLLIKYPQTDKDSNSQFIMPKFRGQKLTYEEEMKLISKQTRKDNPLYLNKFNARNYQNRVAPMSQKNARSHSKDSPKNQKKFMSHTNQGFNMNKKEFNLNDKQKEINTGFSIQNQMNLTQTKAYAPIQVDQQVQQPTENSQNNFTQNQNKITNQSKEQNLIENQQKQQDSRPNFFTKKDYFKDEISQVFRVSQKDLLFKINGPFWKSQMSNNN